jgi:hypothetical protein
MTAISRFAIKLFFALVFITAAQAYLGFGEAKYIVQFNIWYAMYFGLTSAGFAYWSVHPIIRGWRLQNDEQEVVRGHSLVRITEDKITEPVIALPAPRREQSDATRYRPRAGQYSNKAIAPQEARRKALRNRFSDESMEHYERYVPKNKKSEYMY